jgi:AMMECR1 domain-containing protein
MHTQFEMLARINRWSDADRAAYLAISLRGSAATVLTNLPPDQRQNYASLTAALQSRFGTAHQTELNRVKLKVRTRRREETLPELAEDILFAWPTLMPLSQW